MLLGEEEMVVVLLNQTFDARMLHKQQFFMKFYKEDNNNRRSFPYWKHARFDLELLDGKECLLDFWFTKKGYNSFVSYFWTSRYQENIKSSYSFINEPLFIACRWLAFPCRYDKMIARFGRSVSDFSLI